MALRNRILMCPMGDSLCETDGSISANQAAYFEARARGGAALLLVGSVSISYPEGCFDDRQTAASHDRFLPGLSDLTDRVHRHGARIAAQLVHNGAMGLKDVAEGRAMLVPSVPKPPNPDRYAAMVTETEMAAMMSPYTQPTSRLEYRVASESDIAWLVETFAEAAERCVRAGFDGIELHAGHGYLIDEFLSPAMNTRTDGWGGGVEGRSRLLLEVIRAIRARVGAEVPLWIRINAVEHHKPGGEVFEEQLQVIEMAVAEGLDAVHVTAYADTDVSTGATDGYAPHTYEPGRPGSLTEYARAVRERVAVPVITFGRMEPDEAEQVLADGKADFVAFGRKLLADPDLPNKLAEGRVDDIRPCIYQYRCIGNIFVKESLHCVGNAATGREHDLAMPPTERPRRVLVVGGGPGGLEAARLLAGRGHRVTVWEAGPQLGGMLRYAGHADALLDRYLGWLIRQVEQAGVELVVGRRADVGAVRDAGADDVVVATGASWGRPEIPGADGDPGPRIRAIPDLDVWLRGDRGALEGERVVILGGGKPGVSIARRCLDEGRTVTLVEATHVFCGELGLPGRWRLVPDLVRDGVRLLPNATLEALAPDGVRVRVGEGTEVLPADVVVSAGPVVPEDALATALRDAGLPVHMVGDCGGVRRLEGANLDAAHVALAIV
jgi:2,4-dienoyl-CoA reductase-like NADH-dependent reductase (Old Yellow Enzyme family)/thioredoxin reductase